MTSYEENQKKLRETFLSDKIVASTYTDFNLHKVEVKEFYASLKRGFLSLSHAFAVIFFAMFIRTLFDIGTVEWYIGVCDGIITCGILAAFVYVWDLGRRI